MTHVKKVTPDDARQAVGMLDFDQNLTIDCRDADAYRLEKQLLGLYRNMNLMIINYQGEELYVERPRPKGL